MKDGATFRDMIIKHEQQILNFSQVMLRFSESIEKIDMRSDERMTKMGDGIGELNNTMSKVLAVLRSEVGYDGTQGTVGRTIAAIDLKVTELTKDVNKREKALDSRIDALELWRSGMAAVILVLAWLAMFLKK